MVQNVTDADFGRQVEQSPLVIVKYYADWCGTCKLFAPKFKRMSDNPQYSHITFLEVNAEENPEARKAAGVNNLPFMATFKNGQLVEAYATGKEEAVVEMLSKLS